MKVKTILKKLRTENLFGKPVKILKVSSKAPKELEGKTGTLTNPFAGFEVEGIGIFLDNNEPDVCNLGLEDDIEIIG
jgi:hypothetical protein